METDFLANPGTVACFKEIVDLTNLSLGMFIGAFLILIVGVYMSKKVRSGG